MKKQIKEDTRTPNSRSFKAEASLRSRRLEVVGEERTGAREGDTRGVREPKIEPEDKIQT